MKKSKKIQKMVLNRETLFRLQPAMLQLEAGKIAGGNTGPSCEIFRACTIGGWDCTWAEC